ncbi:MAG: SLC26A/SulP transporter family protein [Polyangiaceae bacterium]|nr:SLC26A/SulP transporter family protein [Polyangiaceae bacterium]
MQGQDSAPLSSIPVPSAARGIRGSRWLSGLFAGAMSGTLVATFSITLAALIFSGNLTQYLSRGIGMALAGSAIVGVIVSLGSSFRPAIAAPQENTAVVLALVASAIGTNMAARGGGDPFPTIVAVFILSALVTGGVFLLLGVLRLGTIVRFIPYPVVGGFLAGTGWLLLTGSISVMIDAPLTLGNLGALLKMGALINWLPGLALGVVLTLLIRRYHHFLLLPGLLVAAIGLFYAIIYLGFGNIQEASARGMLLGPFHGGALWPPMATSEISKVAWSEVLANSGNLFAIIMLATISILLNASGLEIATEREIDLDRELRATGVANLAAGLGFGMVGYLSLSESTLNHKAGAESRLAGIVSAGICGAALLFGASVFSYFPKPVLGGLLVFLGLGFLVETLYDSWFRLPRLEYGLVVTILVVIALAGFLEGIGVGIVVSSVLFAVNYSRIDVIKRALIGGEVRSNVERSAGDELTLEDRGKELYILQLQGYIFFGTSYTLLKRVHQRMLSEDSGPTRFVLLDFRHVDGIDSSAILSFVRMRKLAESHGVTLVLTDLPPAVKKQLDRGGFSDDSKRVRFFPDLDHGLEWCENKILQGAPPSMLPPTKLLDELENVFGSRELVSKFLEYLEKVEAPSGYRIYRQGDVSKDLYLIETGELAAWLELSGGKTKRLRTMGPGTVVGESGLYLGAKRSATVVSVTPAVLYRLSIDSLERITHESPHLAAAFHQFVVRLLAERLVLATGASKSLFN